MHSLTGSVNAFVPREQGFVPRFLSNITRAALLSPVGHMLQGKEQQNFWT